MTTETQYQPDRVEETNFQKNFQADVAETAAKIKQTLAQARQLEQEIGTLVAQIESGLETPERIERHEALLEQRDELHRSQYELLSTALAHRHTPEEVQEWFERAEAMGAARPRISGALIADLMYERKVPNAPFRARHAELLPTGTGLIDEAAAEVANGGMTRLVRLLGVRGTANRGRYQQSLQLFMPYDTAVKLARVWGMKPVEAGI